MKNHDPRHEIPQQYLELEAAARRTLSLVPAARPSLAPALQSLDEHRFSRATSPTAKDEIRDLLVEVASHLDGHGICEVEQCRSADLRARILAVLDKELPLDPYASKLQAYVGSLPAAKETP